MSKNKVEMLDIGRAGEHLVMADLLLNGEKCYTTDQGLNYDLVVDRAGQMLRGQVKTTQKMRVLHQSANPIYFFHIKRAGKNGNKRYNVGDFEFFALVSIDNRRVFYLPFNNAVGTASICVRDKEIEYTGQATGGKKNGLYYQDLTWEALCQKLL